MRKILIALALMIASISANAGNVLENSYVTIKGGATALTHPKYAGYADWSHSIQSAVSLQVGTWITESFGAAIDGTVGIDNGSAVGLFKTHTLFNYVDVSALAKYRVRFGTLDVVAAAGPSWIHGFAETLSNNIGTKFQIEFDVNLNKHLALNIVPEFNYNFFGPGKYQPYFDSRQSWYGLMAGVTYKFGDNFEKADPALKYTQADVDALNAEINALRARTPETIEVEKEVVKVVEIQKATPTTVVFFDHASSELTTDAKTALDAVAGPVSVTGGASKDGSAAFNEKLAGERARVVTEYLQARGIKVTDTINGGVLGSRVAIVKIAE